MKIISKLFIMGLLAIFLLSCSGQPIKIASVNDQKTIDKTRGRKISAEAGGFQLLLLIPIRVNSRHERAYKALLDQAGTDAVTDVTIKESWAYGFIGTTYWTEIEAMAYPRIRQ